MSKQVYKKLLLSGATITPKTGPSSDHTTGTGHYLYIDQSKATEGQEAILSSPVLTASKVTGGSCFSFWYHMYGANIGELKVIVQPSTQPDVQLQQWYKYTSQGDEWILAEVNIFTETDFIIKMVAVTSSVKGDQGDIAIDDISYTGMFSL